MDLWQVLFEVLAGLVVGFAVGLTGVGGGALMTPLLHLGFGVPVPTAVGTDLFYAALTKASGAWVHIRRGEVNWWIAKRLLAGSIPSAMATIGVIELLAIEESAFANLITITLSVALLLTAVFLLTRNRIVAWVRHEERLSAVRRIVREYRSTLTVTGGSALGVLVTLTSVGSGVLGTTLILFLFPGLTTLGVVGTELVHAVPLTFVAGMGHLVSDVGRVDGWLLVALLIGALPGVYAGSRLASRIADGVLRPLLATMLLGIGIWLGFDAITGAIH